MAPGGSIIIRMRTKAPLPATSATLLLLLMVTWVTKAQHAAAPCPFNAMCSCKMTRSTDYDIQDGRDAHDAMDAVDAVKTHSKPIISDVSCVGVPFAALPRNH